MEQGVGQLGRLKWCRRPRGRVHNAKEIPGVQRWSVMGEWERKIRLAGQAGEENKEELGWRGKQRSGKPKGKGRPIREWAVGLQPV